MSDMGWADRLRAMFYGYEEPDPRTAPRQTAPAPEPPPNTRGHVEVLPISVGPGVGPVEDEGPHPRDPMPGLGLPIDHGAPPAAPAAPPPGPPQLSDDRRSFARSIPALMAFVDTHGFEALPPEDQELFLRVMQSLQEQTGTP